MLALPVAPRRIHTGSDFVELVLCFMAGTQIATPTGEVPVERLAVGDKC